MADILADDHIFNIFSGDKYCVVILIPLKFVPGGPIDICITIGSGNGLTSYKLQAIIWTNGDLVNRLKPEKIYPRVADRIWSLETNCV